MIKFMSTDAENGRKKLGMVITEDNVNELKKGNPIHFHSEQMGLTNIECNEVIIIYFKTIEEAIKFFNDNGLLQGAQIINE